MGVGSLRNEERFMILPEDLPAFLKAIKEILQQKKFSEKPVVRTIYFNSDDYPIPWAQTIKARTFLADFSREIRLDPEEIYRLDIKSGAEGYLKSKLQEELPLGEAIRFVSANLHLNLRPYVAVEYLRSHFVSERVPDLLRLTVDQNVQYFLPSEGAGPATWLGSEDFGRVELKVAPAYRDSADHLKVSGLILNSNLMPVISKREHAFSMVGLAIDKKGAHPPKKEITDCEIEAKFLVRHPNPAALLADLKNYLRQGAGNYEVAAHFPYTQEGSAINNYWAKQARDGELQEGLKLMFIGRRVKPVFKKETRLLSDPYGLHCILERQEVKAEPFIYTPQKFQDYLEQTKKTTGELCYLGRLLRSRRAFWPENRATKRIFHISLDKCEARDGQKVLWQMEIEYVGRYQEYVTAGRDAKEVKAEIGGEVAELSNIVLLFCNRNQSSLFPTTLTKFNWLRSI